MEAQITSISHHGIWLFINEQEYFLSFVAFPWFKDAAVSAVFNVQQPHAGHLYWPDLDVDLTLDSIRSPERFPLIARPH